MIALLNKWISLTINEYVRADEKYWLTMWFSECRLITFKIHWIIVRMALTDVGNGTNVTVWTKGYFFDPVSGHGFYSTADSDSLLSASGGSNDASASFISMLCNDDNFLKVNAYVYIYIYIYIVLRIK